MRNIVLSKRSETSISVESHTDPHSRNRWSTALHAGIVFSFCSPQAHAHFAFNRSWPSHQLPGPVSYPFLGSSRTIPTISWSNCGVETSICIAFIHLTGRLSRSLLLLLAAASHVGPPNGDAEFYRPSRCVCALTCHPLLSFFFPWLHPSLGHSGDALFQSTRILHSITTLGFVSSGMTHSTCDLGVIIVLPIDLPSIGKGVGWKVKGVGVGCGHKAGGHLGALKINEGAWCGQEAVDA